MGSQKRKKGIHEWGHLNSGTNPFSSLSPTFLGNTVILGLSTAGLPSNPHAWLTTFTSIISFLIGARLTFQISHAISPQGASHNRALTSALFLLQGLLIILAAVLSSIPGLIPQNPGATDSRQLREQAREAVIDNIRIVSLFPPLGLQAGMQIATSRLLGFNELPVNVLTSTYCDLMGDFHLLALQNVKRNRRLLAVGCLLVGAVASGWLLRTSGGLPSVLWIAAGIKTLTGVAMFIWLPVAKEP